MNGFLRFRGLGLVAAVCCSVTVAGARPAPLTKWDRAVADRQAFEGLGAGTRSKLGYNRVMDEFRAIYHSNPADGHAPDAIYAVAELLAEQGRELHDEGSLRAAVAQFEFLRKQYPGSGLRTNALLAEGRIDETDLGDAAGAKERFALVVKEAPRSESAGVARAELVTLRAGAGAGPTHRDTAAMNGARSGSSAAKPEPAVTGLRLTEENARLVEGGDAGSSAGLRNDKPIGVRNDAPKVDSVPVLETHVPEAGHGAPIVPVRKGALAQVTGIRHWSTPTYTRVAIDLGDEVTFEAARVPHPDRIYFDLYGARLAQELVGKSFDVTDDGFLKKIRAAQATGDVTRVVLDVNDVTEYSAFLLPNPYRLIIDIHGGSGGGAGAPAKAKAPVDEVAEVPVAPAAAKTASAAANRSGLPAMAPTDGGDAVRLPGGSGRASLEAHPNGDETAVRMGHTTFSQTPNSSSAPTSAAPAPSSVPAPRTGTVARSTVARPVPNTVAVKAPANATEVAAVSEAPGRVDATSAPTSRPIVANVPVPRDVSLGTNTVGTSTKRSRKAAAGSDLDAAPARAAEKTADGETSLVRALGLKIGRIVIDAGHGGHDSGTLGVDGIQEKDVVLDVALRLGKLLHERLGAEIIYTRSDDTFIPLETRTAIANKAQADLFLSIHANSSQDETARGVETYYLNFTSDPTALDVAARENAVSGQSIHQLSDLVKKITLKDKIAESREFAGDVEGSLYGGLAKGNEGLKNRGVKKAPFVVLIGANMPSVLAEISFVTNGKDAAQLRRPEYRERVAESLYNGVAKYESGLGTKVPVVRASAQ
ncbi:N-acetylmuramoyl-L-alanine amidase [Granulicella tundricola]|uniref:N-acetylmuramoyl-L-alanine amidase n=1 Tax=Granulicella tundricola (strain ATCC BAA-1859 / DSM 23138 / MP5ACTX9) TaxID=1198114 RepID=E8WYK4_GRATM|nr:N-acetylmuramoyl-L-alanine amidase [Granulicella tundricola]ADW67602.1 cell wall hydrolase/autolysin [Granulicella tundricola MP5ACTX9]